MATLDVGGHGGRRDVNREIPLVPFIDFLLCIVAFLLVTAVWSEMARVEASAKVPGPADAVTPADEKPLELHVDARRVGTFALSWRRGSVVLEEVHVPRRPLVTGGSVSYPDLASRVDAEWARRGSHRGGTDGARDLAVLHVENSASFEDVVATMDAIHTPARALGGKSVPAFDVVFAVD